MTTLTWLGVIAIVLLAWIFSKLRDLGLVLVKISHEITGVRSDLGLIYRELEKLHQQED